MVTSTAISNIFDAFDRNQLTPYAVGFDRVFDRLQDYASHQMTSTGFPPYNIRKDGDYNYVIELALAGMSKSDLEVEVADGVLCVRTMGKKDETVELLHRGISHRQFNRKWTLADDVIVKEAKMENGMLLIQLERVVPEEKKPRLISIK
jgi:molecular chaperone IbpA